MSKIVHICVGGPYTDGFTYQENLLTKHHRLLGYEVVLVASPLYFGSDGTVKRANPGRYVNEDGVTVVRLSFAKPEALSAKLKKVVGLNGLLEEEAPDIIFLHGIQTMAAHDVARYIKCHSRVKLFVDNHVDESNMGGKLHRLLIDETLWRYEGSLLVPYATTFYGVLPARVRTLSEVYKIPAEKCRLLVMGYDDCPDEKEQSEANLVVDSWLKKEGILDSDFVLCTGGKIDAFKREVWTLLRFVSSGKMPEGMKLVVFGSVEKNREKEFAALCNSSNQLCYFGWADKYQINALINRSNAGIFPGRHSVLWEQVAGQGTPLIIKSLYGLEHLDINGNVWCLGEVIDEASLDRMVKHIGDVKAFGTQGAAAKKAADAFQYSNIAHVSIGMEL